MSPCDREQYHPYWQPGVPLPIPRSNTPASRIPRRVSLCTPPQIPFSQVDSDEEHINDGTGDGDTLEITLKSILDNQKQIRKQMDHFIHRVDALEDSVKESPSLSSTSDEKTTSQLSSELCVS